jgi:hypothetical protein
MGYGFVTFAIMVIVGGIMRLLPERYCRAANWTVAREIRWTTLLVALIGLGNLLYSHALGFIALSWRGLVQFELYTVAIGLFPITLLVLLNEARLNRRFAASSAQINQDLHQTGELVPDEVQVSIPSENQSDNLQLPADAILLIQAADNYAEVITLPSHPPGRHLVRATLMATEAALSGHPQFLRCHKSYIVNLHHVKSVSGNAQGYKLHVPGIPAPVPVSRQRNQELRKAFVIGP